MSELLEGWLDSSKIKWTKVLTNTIQLGSHYKVVPTEGYLAWEYNPLRNYRLSQNMYEKNGKYYTQEEFQNLLGYQNMPNELPDGWTLYEEGQLVDFITDELSFNLKHPIDILPQYSYDGSVNLILNDGLNIPRLINSRFTTTGKNTYKIVDRKGDNDTNIYDQGDQFDVDTSLFKNVNKIPKLEYLGTSNGNMKIGNYHFYFKYADADGNESDWVAESGLVSVFIGNTPKAINTGIRDENSIKSVRFKLSNIDIGYSYVKVYYTRYSADIDSNLVVSAKRIDKNFLINSSGICSILINGDENETDVTLEEINSTFDVIQNAQTQCSAAGRLFMANIHKTKIEYDILSKLSLCFCPYKTEETYPLTDGIDVNYHISSVSEGYYDTQYIYDKTGYWPEELYRLGVVYILKDGSLSPVFNIRGATNIPVKPVGESSTPYYTIEQDFKNKTLDEILASIDYSEEDFMIVGGKAPNENAKGVIQLQASSENTFPVLGINITANHQIIEALKKYAKGFFFVRQKRMPLTLCQGLVVGVDKESRTPTLPTLGGVINNIETDGTYIESPDINDINYVSEGFLSRYKYNLKAKNTGFWSKFGNALVSVAVLAAAAAATVVTCGAASVLVGPAIAIAGALKTIGVVAAITSVGVTASIATQTVALKLRQNRIQNKAAKVIHGRHESIPGGYSRKEQDDSRKLVQDVLNRYIITDLTKNSPDAIIVPDYQVNQPYYNQFLTGDSFTIKLATEQPSTNYLTDGYLLSNDRHFYVERYNYQSDNRAYSVELVGVPDGCPIKMIDNDKYCARAGYPEEAFKYEFQGTSYDDSVNKIANSDVIRGYYGSYVGMKGYRGHACDQVNIMIPGYKENELFNYVQLRAQDTSAFYAISDRIDLSEINKPTSILQESEYVASDYSLVCYRGDSYICQYTHRINRNFNDPSAPYNDKIVDANTWKNHYNPDKPEDYNKINLGDVNAVQLGTWLTFQLRSSYNLNIRTIDKSNVDEYLMCGNYRSFYPNYGQLASGSQKIPDSDQYNKGFSKSVSEKYYFEVPDVPYIKQEFQNRIVFSDIHINDAYKNGFRVIRTMNHKDFPMTHGSITKILELKNALLIVFEHGIGLVSINNQAEHSSQILSDLNVISDTYGSQWKDSIIKTPSGVYGVDTIAKKIWRVKEGQIELISDMKVQEFLNKNISLTEKELTSIIGIRNVKTVYNAYKHDVMFTFYDNTYSYSEKSWNLCWNEILGIFTTFYSWIPSEMSNINNIPFSFDRDTVKAIAKLGVSDHENNFSDGITLTNNVINVYNASVSVDNRNLELFFFNKRGEREQYKLKSSYIQAIVYQPNFIGFLHLDNRTLPDKQVKYHITYDLLRDNQHNHELFEIINTEIPLNTDTETINGVISSVKVSYLRLKDARKARWLNSELYYRNKAGNSYADSDTNKQKPTQESSNNLIEGTYIKNKAILIRYKDCYGEDAMLGYTRTKAPLQEITEVCTIKQLLESGVLKEVPADINPDVWYDNVYYNSVPVNNLQVIDLNQTRIYMSYPIFKNKQGKRVMLPKELQVNPDKIVRYLNIKAQVAIDIDPTNPDKGAYYQSFTDEKSTLIDAGYFESQVAVTTKFNLSLLSTDFWKHGQAGIMDITDNILPTYWYGKQHPFEFECVVVDDPSIHKIFTNLELVSNKVKPESFHYEVVGDVYDFSDDKPTMYFRQEALKALYQYNGYDIEYNPNFLEIEPKQHNRSADLPKYYSRWDTVNDIYDSYKRFSAPVGFNYDHLAGAEIVYYPTRNEFRIWNHVEAIDVDSLSQDIATSVIKANCRYLEDKWLVSINPIIVTYKNEYDKDKALNEGKSIFTYSTWVPAQQGSGFSSLPPINIQGTKLVQKLGTNAIEFPQGDYGKDNALYGLYDLELWNKGDWRPINPTKNKDRRETDVRGKFMKVRVRYSGDELAIIDFLNTIYQISFA